MAALLACNSEQNYDKPLTPVIVQTVEAMPAKGQTRYSASVSPRTQVDLAFKVGGYVNDLLQIRERDGTMRWVQGGDRVQRGQVLARLRESDYVVKLNQAKSNEADAQANLRQAELDFERARNLFATQSLTQSDYDAAEARYKSAQAKLQGATASRKEAEISVQDSSLKAPSTGVVLKRNVEVRSLVSAGTVAFVLADTSTVKVLFGVADVTMPHLQLGRPLAVATEAIPGEEFQGRITRIDPSADPTSRTFQIEIEIPNRDNRLKPGMIAAISLEGNEESAGRMAVPLSAIVRSPQNDGQYGLYVVDQQGGKAVARLRPVKLGPLLGNTVVVSEGIKSGETVVVKGTTLIIDGEQVRVVPTSSSPS
jgi:RND family efflux transporter MFP subunit